MVAAPWTRLLNVDGGRINNQRALQALRLQALARSHRGLAALQLVEWGHSSISRVSRALWFMHRGARRSSDGVAPVVWQRILLSQNVPPRVLRVPRKRPYSPDHARAVGAPRRLPGSCVGFIMRLPFRRIRFILRLRHVVGAGLGRLWSAVAVSSQ